jgi:RND family efflux transporter MFP subunit
MSPSRRNALIAAGIVAGAVALAVILVMIRPEPPRTPPPPRSPIVGTAPADDAGGALTVTGSGTVRPRAEIDLSPQVGGRIEWVSPRLVSGARIDAGEVLVRIEQADYRNAVEQARAQVAQDQVALLQAQEEARIARREYEQFRRRQPEAAAAAGEPSALTLRQPQLDAAQAALERSRAQLADAELALERTTLEAPFEGVVRSETVDLGAFATAGQPVATLYATDAVEVVVPFSDEDAALIPGLWALRGRGDDPRIEARIIARFGRDDYAWQGFVDRAEAALDEESRTLDVVVRVPDPFAPGTPVGQAPEAGAPPLLVGQFADVEIQGRDGPWVRVPRRALRTGDEVWVAREGEDDEGMVLRIVPVTVVQRSGEHVYLTGDLGAGDAVIVEGVSVATDGMKVRLQSEVES